MPLVHIIGNGFDINAGLPTRYSDFYNYYLGKDLGNVLDLPRALNPDSKSKPDSPVIERFKQDMQNDLSVSIERWSDMEIALGRYCKKIENPDQFDEIFIDLGDQLKKYLGMVESLIPNISESNEALDRFYLSLLEPEKLSGVSWPDHKISQRRMEDVSVISFNYTRTLESIISPDKLNVRHVHGTLSNEIIIGVNSVNQIINDEFRANQDVVDALVKPTTNKIINKPVLDECIAAIDNADVISIFGSSLGPTDQFWWDLIGKRVSTGKLKVIMFDRPLARDSNREYKIDKITRDRRAIFKAKDNKSFDNYESNIAVVTQTNMFKVFDHLKSPEEFT